MTEDSNVSDESDKNVKPIAKNRSPASKRKATRERILVTQRNTSCGIDRKIMVMSIYSSCSTYGCEYFGFVTKRKPLGATYLALWFRTFDEMIVDTSDESVIAYESGFHSERRITSWQSRIALLEEFGFIKTQKIGSRYQYVLLLHPVKSVEELNNKGLIQKEMYDLFMHRAYAVGAIS